MSTGYYAKGQRYYPSSFGRTFRFEIPASGDAFDREETCARARARVVVDEIFVRRRWTKSATTKGALRTTECNGGMERGDFIALTTLAPPPS